MKHSEISSGYIFGKKANRMMIIPISEREKRDLTGILNSYKNIVFIVEFYSVGLLVPHKIYDQ